MDPTAPALERAEVLRPEPSTATGLAVLHAATVDGRSWAHQWGAGVLVDAVEAACVNEIGRSPSVPALYLLCDVAVSVASRLDDPTECANAVAWTLLEVGAPATPTTRPIFEAVPHNRAGLWAWRLAEELACIDSELTALLSQVRFDPAGRLLDDPGPKVTAAVLARIGSATAGLLSRHADMATNMRPGGGLRVDAVIPAGAEVASI